MKFVLILILAQQGVNLVPSVTMAEFDDKPACEAARFETIKLMDEIATVGTFRRYTCMPKGTAAAKK